MSTKHGVVGIRKDETNTPSVVIRTRRCFFSWNAKVDTERFVGDILRFFGRLLAHRIWPWLSSRRDEIVVCTLAGVVVYLFATNYLAKNIADIDFYVGGSGGKNAEIAQTIQSKLAKGRNALGRTHQLDIHYTDGYKENYDLVSEDRHGRRIAFAYDGMNELEGIGDHGDVRLLLPLQWSYLHIIARKQFVNELLDEKTSAEQLTLSLHDLAKRIRLKEKPKPPSELDSQTRTLWSHLFVRRVPERHARFFLGREQTATRDLAVQILNQCDLNPTLFEDATVRDFGDMRARLNRNELDIAFYTGPIDSSTIRNIAQDGNCYLIGLREIYEAIRTKMPFLAHGEFPPNVYPRGFCKPKLHTLLMRKVLICDDDMDTRDAYTVGHALKDALPQEVNYEATSPSGTQQNAKFEFQEHEAFKAIKADNAPRQFPEWLKTAGSIVGFVLLSELFGFISRAVSTKNKASSQYVKLSNQMTQLGAAAIADTIDPARASKNLAAIRSQLKKARRTKQIRPAEAATLDDVADDLAHVIAEKTQTTAETTKTATESKSELNSPSEPIWH